MSFIEVCALSFYGVWAGVELIENNTHSNLEKASFYSPGLNVEGSFNYNL